jgi:Flp pilus assembly pilin Flp
MPRLIVRLYKDQKGQDIVEYALLLVLIVLMMMAATRKFSQTLQDAYSGIADTLAAVTTTGGQSSGGTGNGAGNGSNSGSGH